jgi:hypothetical protein
MEMPDDQSTVKADHGQFKGQTVGRVRSMSMNNFVGGNGELAFNPGWTQDGWPSHLAGLSKLEDMIDPGPTMTWVLLDEREGQHERSDFGDADERLSIWLYHD